METLPPVARSRPDVPPGVQRVLAKATAKDSDDRYASCGEFLAELAAVLVAHHPASPAAPAERYPPHSAPRTDPPARATASATASGRSPAPPDERPRRPRRRVLQVMIGAAVVLALAAAGVYMFLSGDTKTTHFAGTGTVPVSFDYPADWYRQDNGSIQMVVSPHPGEFLSLFSLQPGAWADVDRLLNDDRSKAIGMYVTFNNTDYANAPRDSTREDLTSLLPQTSDLQGPSPTKVGDEPGALMASGTLSDPAGSGPKMSVDYYVVPLAGQTIHLVFFADAASFRDQEATFERIAESIGPPD
jgi:hypothetical protein